MRRLRRAFDAIMRLEIEILEIWRSHSSVNKGTGLAIAIVQCLILRTGREEPHMMAFCDNDGSQLDIWDHLDAQYFRSCGKAVADLWQFVFFDLRILL